MFNEPKTTQKNLVMRKFNEHFVKKKIGEINSEKVKKKTTITTNYKPITRNEEMIK